MSGPVGKVAVRCSFLLLRRSHISLSFSVSGNSSRHHIESWSSFVDVGINYWPLSVVDMRGGYPSPLSVSLYAVAARRLHKFFIAESFEFSPIFIHPYSGGWCLWIGTIKINYFSTGIHYNSWWCYVELRLTSLWISFKCHQAELCSLKNLPVILPTLGEAIQKSFFAFNKTDRFVSLWSIPSSRGKRSQKSSYTGWYKSRQKGLHPFKLTIACLSVESVWA